MVQKPTTIGISVIVAGILILSAISSTNQAFAQAMTRTTLSIGTYPNSARQGQPSAPFSGHLLSEGNIDKPIAAATITIAVAGITTHATTDGFGSYLVRVPLPMSLGKHTVTARYAGDSEHEPSSGTFTINIIA